MLAPKCISVLRCPEFIQVHAFARGKPFPALRRLEDSFIYHLGVLWCGIYRQTTQYPHLKELFLPRPWNFSKWPHLQLKTISTSDVQFIFLHSSNFWMMKQFGTWLCEGIWNISWGCLTDQSSDMRLPFVHIPHPHIETHIHIEYFKDLVKNWQDYGDAVPTANSYLIWIKVSSLSSEQVRIAFSREPNGTK